MTANDAMRVQQTMREPSPRRGRPPKATAEAVIDEAMRRFWRQGYARTTIDDLVRGTGVNRFALYGRHGGKAGLFLEALGHYREAVMLKATAPLREDAAGLEAIRALFQRLLASLDAPDGRQGCLICASAMEKAALEPEARARVEACLGELRDLLAQALAQARARGEIPASSDPAMLADYLVAAVVGFRSAARSTLPREVVANYARGVLAHLDALSTSTDTPSTSNPS